MKFSNLCFPFLIVFIAFGCTDNNSLLNGYLCKTESLQSKAIPDALQKFTLSVPNNWKTELYINNKSSTFITADTTKQLSQAFIIKVSSIPGGLNFNKTLAKSLKLKLAENNWKTKKITKGLFKSHNSLLFRTEKQDSKIKTSALQLFFNAPNQYHFEVEIQCFGNKNIQKRFCKAVVILKTLKLN